MNIRKLLQITTLVLLLTACSYTKTAIYEVILEGNIRTTVSRVLYQPTGMTDEEVANHIKLQIHSVTIIDTDSEGYSSQKTLKVLKIKLVEIR